MKESTTDAGSAQPAFLRGGGEMGHLTRIHDWTQTPLGPPDTWPQNLRTTLGILLNSKFPMFLFWGEELLCFYNDAYRPSLGNNGNHPHALGRPASEVWVLIWEDTVGPLTTHIRNGGEATWSEDEFMPIYRNGGLEDSYWTFSFSPVLDESSQVAGVLVTCIETTDKVVGLQKLAESKDQLHFAVESAELATFDYNPITNKFTGNDRLREWFGLPPEVEIELATALAVIAEKNRQLVTDSIKKTLDFASGGGYDIEYTLIAPPTNVERIVRAKGRAWFGEDQVAYRFNGTLQDITQQVKTREKLEAEKTRFMTLLETMPNMAWTTDSEGKLTFINQCWYDYTGLSIEETFSVGWEITTHSDDLSAVIEIIRHSLKTGDSYMAEYRLRRTDGAYRWHLGRATAIRDEAGEIVSWLGTTTDIHEQKQTQIRLDELVRQRTQQLEASMQELRRSNENLQQFAYVASHDLQEPLRKIQSFGDILKKRYEIQLGDGADYLNRMQSAANRMSVLIDDLLTFSRITTRQEAADEVSLEKVVRDVLHNLELRIRETQASIEIEPLPVVQGDASQLNQLFQNLLSNALKFQKSETQPVIRVVTTEVSAADLPPEVQPGRQAAALK